MTYHLALTTFDLQILIFNHVFYKEPIIKARAVIFYFRCTIYLFNGSNKAFLIKSDYQRKSGIEFCIIGFLHRPLDVDVDHTGLITSYFAVN